MIPVDLQVIASPQVELSSSELEFNLSEGKTKRQSLALKNTGGSELTYFIEHTANAWLTIESDRDSTLAVGDSARLWFSATSPKSGEQTLTDSMVLLTNIGNYTIHVALNVTVGIGVDQTQETMVYPNPFFNEVWFSLWGPVEKIAVYNVLGQMVIELPSSKQKEISWDGCDANGVKLAPGTYIYTIFYSSFTQTGKIVCGQQ